MITVSARYAEIDDDPKALRPFFRWFMCVRCKAILDSPDYNGKWIPQVVSHHDVFITGCFDKKCGFCIKSISPEEPVSLLIPGQTDSFFHLSKRDPPDWHEWFGIGRKGCILLEREIEIET